MHVTYVGVNGSLFLCLSFYVALRWTGHLSSAFAPWQLGLRKRRRRTHYRRYTGTVFITDRGITNVNKPLSEIGYNHILAKVYTVNCSHENQKTLNWGSWMIPLCFCSAVIIFMGVLVTLASLLHCVSPFLFSLSSSLVSQSPTSPPLHRLPSEICVVCLWEH